MTLPFERYNALKNSRDFLYRLLDPAQTPRVPSHIRREAAALLKHFPAEYQLEEIKEQAKDLLGDWEG